MRRFGIKQKRNDTADQRKNRCNRENRAGLRNLRITRGKFKIFTDIGRRNSGLTVGLYYKILTVILYIFLITHRSPLYPSAHKRVEFARYAFRHLPKKRTQITILLYHNDTIIPKASHFVNTKKLKFGHLSIFSHGLSLFIIFKARKRGTLLRSVPHTVQFLKAYLPCSRAKVTVVASQTSVGPKY